MLVVFKNISIFKKIFLLLIASNLLMIVITFVFSRYLWLHTEQNIIAFSLIFLYIALVSIVVFFINNRLKKHLKPINKLITGMNEISKGNYTTKLSVEGQTEIDLICKRFNHLSSQVSNIVQKIMTISQNNNEQLDAGVLTNLDSVFNEIDRIIDKSLLIRDLQRAEKMNAVGQLAASVAHEIRNPMTVVKGFLQIFLAKEQMSEEERMYIHLMIDEMNRAEQIINDYLSLAKPDMEQIENIDGKDLAEKVMDLMHSYAMMSKNISIVNQNFERIILRGNKNELQQVLINILKNAIEAMKTGGTLSISLYEEEEFGVFEIKDTGIGMTSDELKRLGTAFYSLKEKGTGIGLTISYQIIDRMKGKIEVESEKGVGTTFKVFVPKKVMVAL